MYRWSILRSFFRAVHAFKMAGRQYRSSKEMTCNQSQMYVNVFIDSCSFELPVDNYFNNDSNGANVLQKIFSGDLFLSPFGGS